MREKVPQLDFQSKLSESRFRRVACWWLSLWVWAWSLLGLVARLLCSAGQSLEEARNRPKMRSTRAPTDRRISKSAGRQVSPVDDLSFSSGFFLDVLCSGTLVHCTESHGFRTSRCLLFWTVCEMAGPVLPDGCDVAASISYALSRQPLFLSESLRRRFGLVSPHRPAYVLRCFSSSTLRRHVSRALQLLRQRPPDSV